MKNKKCACCGKSHETVPENARPQMSFTEDFVEGWFFECTCGSTMYVPDNQKEETNGSLKKN